MISIIKELLAYRKELYKKVKQDGFIYDAWNNKFLLSDRKKITEEGSSPVASLVSTRIQSIRNGHYRTNL